MYKITFTLLLIAALQPAASASHRPQPREGSIASARITRPRGRDLQTPTAKVKDTARKTAPVVVARAGPARQSRVASKDRTKKVARSRAGEEVTFQSGESLRVVRATSRLAREHRDPNRSGNPLLDTSGDNRAKKLSKNFTVGEFARSGKKTFDVARIASRHVGCLQDIRDYVERPVRIDSGYRSFKYNRELYERMKKRVTNSQHISGTASDIRIEGMSGEEIAQAAINACGPEVAVGLGQRFAHVDVRGRFGIWKYKGVSDRQVAEVRLYRASKAVAQKARPRRTRGPASRRT